MHLEFDARLLGTSHARATWIRGLQVLKLRKGCRMCPASREGDAHEIFHHCRQLEHLDLIVRARHDRVLGAQGARLFDRIRQAPVQARVEIEVMRSSARRSARGQREKALREARLANCVGRK